MLISILNHQNLKYKHIFFDYDFEDMLISIYMLICLALAPSTRWKEHRECLSNLQRLVQLSSYMLWPICSSLCSARAMFTKQLDAIYPC
jgi:hypothetical protein